MGLLDKLFGKKSDKLKDQQFFKTLTAYRPVFTTWNGSMYESELVRSAIDARARHISKLKVEVCGSGKPKLQTKLRHSPNEWQTWGQFLYRLSTILDMQNTAFIVPVEDEFGNTTGFYPILPSQCELRQAKDGKLWLVYKFFTNGTAAVEFERCGIMNKFQYKDDFFGESNNALHSTLELIDVQKQGISEGVKSAATFRFMAKMGNFATPEDIAKEQKRFTRENLKGEAGGMLLFPNTYSEIQQIKSSPFVIDAEQMAAIEKNIFNYFGVNADILQNTAYGDKWNSFYEGAIEPFSIQFSDVITKMAFNERERAAGSLIMATANRLQYMSNADKLNYASNMADRGLMCRDEIREMLQLPPLPDGTGQLFTMRGEYYLINKDGSTTKGDGKK